MMSTKVARLVEYLQELKGARYNSRAVAGHNHAIADKLLNLIFELSTEEPQFVVTDKRMVGVSIVDALKPIKNNIEHTACKYRTRLETAVLRKRSALQFLIDNYGSFPVGDACLSDKFEEVNLQESIEILDNIIDKWADAEDSDEGESDRETQKSHVPASHVWWF